MTGADLLARAGRLRDGEFPHYDWHGVAEQVGPHIDREESFRLYSEAARAWMDDLAPRIGAGYAVQESAHFLLISSDGPEAMRGHLIALERLLDEIHEALEGIGYDFYGRMPVVLFADHQRFYEYYTEYDDGEGHLRMMEAVYLGAFYPHIIAYVPEGAPLQRYLCHETVHAVIAPLTLPLWLDEAITQEVEHKILSAHPFTLDAREVARHRRYWTPERLAGFWSGEAFSYPDDGSELSYHLARFLLRGLLQDISTEEYTAYLYAVSYQDGGRVAADEVLGIDLDEAVAHFLKG